MEGEIRRGALTGPIDMNSKLHWIISENVDIGSVSCLSVISETESTISFDLERFWRQEEIFDQPSKLLNLDEEEYENHFIRTHSRNPEYGTFAF